VRRSILVVDADVQTQKLLELSLRNEGFEVKTVATAPEALAWLEKHRPDLVIAEAKLEGGPDGYDLCRQLKKRPDGGKIAFVFLSEQTVEGKLKGIEAGADDFLPKPLFVQEVVEHARSLLRRRERDRLETVARGEERFTGSLEDFPLVDLLRAIEHNRKSGIVQLAAPVLGRGEIYFRDGAVIDAEVGRLSGLDAVCRLFAWLDAAFEIEWKTIRRRDVIAMEPGALLIESLRRLDEWRRLLVDVPPLETVFEVDYHLLAERLAEIPDEVNSILRLFDGQRTFIQVIDDCGLSDLDALAVIGKLYREEIIRDVRARPVPTHAPGADIEGWIAEATGPFRALSTRPSRELFGGQQESTTAGIHGRITAPVEPLEEAPAPVVEERRERFTDRLIAEAAPNAPASKVETDRMTAAPPPPARHTPPTMDAMERTQQGIGILAPFVPAPAETTQQGLGSPIPALSTKPGFQAVTNPPAPGVPPPRTARNVLTDVTNSVPELGAREGIPQPVPPQSLEPAIVVPPRAGAPLPALPLEALGSGPVASEQRPVAGEILARPPTVKGMESALSTTAESGPRATAPLGAGEGKRITDLGLGPVQPLPRKGEDKLPTVAAGEVVGAAPRAEETKPQVRKIILDPAIPEDDGTDGPKPRMKWAAVGAGLAVAVVAVVIALKNTGHKRRPELALREKAVASRPVVEQLPGNQAAQPDAGARLADERAADPKVARTGIMLEERWADPKVARALPTEFPTLLSACRQAFTEKRARDAEIACVAAKDANPESAEANALLGHALFGRKKRREALQAAERAVALDPRQADAYVIIGGVKQAAGDKVAAKTAYKRYLELAPNGQYAADLRAIVEAP
jgi:CheY-like chemotaxis protein